MLPFPLHAVVLASMLLDPCAESGAMLAALERSGADLRTFSGALAYERYNAFEEESEFRYGDLALEGSGRDRKIGLVFTQFIDATGRSSQSRDHWLYADGWLAEIDERNRTFTKRQIVAPGRDFDPLKLGEGPIPLPFGQPRSEVEHLFEVRVAPPPSLPLFKSLANVCGLRLDPKPGTPMAEKADYLEIYYERGTLALRGVNLVEEDGDRTTVLLSRPAMNRALTETERALLVMPDPDPKSWQIEVRPWADEAAESNAAAN
jgi:hypothetical protein